MSSIEGKALITGASGFIGGRLRDRLLSEGVDVVAIRRRGSPEARSGRSVEGDYADVSTLRAILEAETPDYVFHVAGATKGVTYDDFQAANVMPTRNLLEAVREAHPALKRFVLVSSFSACGPSEPARPRVESDPPAPIEHYGRSKREAEALLEAERVVPWTIVRPGGVYGPGDADYFQLFRFAHFGLNVFFGNRDRWMSVVYVDDCVRALIEAANSDRTVRQSYFLADGEPITWEAFQAQIVAHARGRALRLDLPEALTHVAAWGGEIASRFDGKPRLFNRQKATMGRQSAWTCAIDKAREDFGFAPTVLPPQGTQLTYEWYRANGWFALRR